MKDLDMKILRKNADAQVEKGEKLRELGEKFESDKEKLEDEIDKIQKSKISDADKRKLLDQINTVIQALQEQYEQDVTDEEEKVKKEFMEQIESMQEAEDELEKMPEDLRSLKMKAASVDISLAIDAAEAKKEAFEKMKAEYVEKLNLQIEQSAIQQRNILNRRLGGR